MKESDTQQNVLDGVIDFFKLYTSNTIIDENPLVGSIHQRVHINDFLVDGHHKRENDNGGWAYVVPLMLLLLHLLEN